VLRVLDVFRLWVKAVFEWGFVDTVDRGPMPLVAVAAPVVIVVVGTVLTFVCADEEKMPAAAVARVLGMKVRG